MPSNNMVSLRLDIPQHLYERLQRRAGNVWGKQARILRAGCRMVLDEMDKYEIELKEKGVDMEPQIPMED